MLSTQGSAASKECSEASVSAWSGVAGERAIATCLAYSVSCDDVYVLRDEFKEGQRAWNKRRRRCSTRRAEGRMMKRRGKKEGGRGEMGVRSKVGHHLGAVLTAYRRTPHYDSSFSQHSTRKLRLLRDLSPLSPWTLSMCAAWLVKHAGTGLVVQSHELFSPRLSLGLHL